MKRHTQQKTNSNKQKVIVLSVAIGVVVIALMTVIIVKAAGKYSASVTDESAIVSQIDIVYGTNADPASSDPGVVDPANPVDTSEPVSVAETVPGTTGGNTIPGGATVTPAPAAATGGTGYVDSSGFIVDLPNNDSVPAPVIPNEPAPTEGTNSTTPTDDDGLVVFPVIPASEL